MIISIAFSITKEGWKELLAYTEQSDCPSDMYAWLDTYEFCYATKDHEYLLFFWNDTDETNNGHIEFHHCILRHIDCKHFTYIEYDGGALYDNRGKLDGDPFGLCWVDAFGETDYLYGDHVKHEYTDLSVKHIGIAENASIPSNSSETLVCTYKCGCGEMLDPKQETKCWRCEVPITV